MYQWYHGTTGSYGNTMVLEYQWYAIAMSIAMLKLQYGPYHGTKNGTMVPLVPWYTCTNMVHVYHWYGDDGNIVEAAPAVYRLLAIH